MITSLFTRLSGVQFNKNNSLKLIFFEIIKDSFPRVEAATKVLLFSRLNQKNEVSI